ncbi:leucine-rich repeat domain-containing protein, partial [Blautia glucerasea]|uniref:leucine-rich repeat domain-containing protein n=1 Tax=Blautia glucerasea TaxID=536633 RepID=UPI001D065247
MKKKRVTALMLALFMVFNDTAHPFGAENIAVENPAEEVVVQEEAGMDSAGEEENEEAAELEITEAPAEENSAEVFENPSEEKNEIDLQEETEVFSDSSESQETGENSDFVIDASGKLTQYNGSDADVVIPDGVTTIGSNVFQNNTTIESVTFPNSLKEIGDYAFNGCTNLKGELILPDNLETIGSYAFFNCSGITGELVIPDKVTYLPRGTFAGMSGVTALTIGSKVNSIYTDSDSSHVFYGMTKVETVTFLGATPPSINYSGVFYHMLKLKTVYVPEGTYKAYNKAYKDTMLESVYLKETGGGDFIVSDGELVGYTGEATDVTIPEGVTRIGERAFYKTQVRKVTISPEVTEIGENAFQGSTALQEVVFSGKNNVAEIGSYAFSGCGELTGFSFGENLTEIKEHTFESC